MLPRRFSARVFFAKPFGKSLAVSVAVLPLQERRCRSVPVKLRALIAARRSAGVIAAPGVQFDRRALGARGMQLGRHWVVTTGPPRFGRPGVQVSWRARNARNVQSAGTFAAARLQSAGAIATSTASLSVDAIATPAVSSQPARPIAHAPLLLVSTFVMSSSRSFFSPGGPCKRVQTQGTEGGGAMTDSKHSDGDVLFSWIHLSDIHFGQGDHRTHLERKLVVDALEEDVAALIQTGSVPRPNAILVTGDVAFSGGKKRVTEYDDARKWLESLSEASTLTPRDVFLVPGNHDVRRDDVSDPRFDRLRSGHDEIDNALADKEVQAMLRKRMAAYLKFASCFASPAHCNFEASHSGLFWRHKRYLSNGVQIRLVGLNTALLAASDDDAGKLRLGLQQIQYASEADNANEVTIVLVMTHHPLDEHWLADYRDAKRGLLPDIDIHLSGHVHRPNSEQLISNADKGFVSVNAGAAHEKAKKGIACGQDGEDDPPPSHAYNFAAIIQTGDGMLRMRIWPRRWIRAERHEGFRRDVANVKGELPYADFFLRKVAPNPPDGTAANAGTRGEMDTASMLGGICNEPELSAQPLLSELFAHVQSVGPASFLCTGLRNPLRFAGSLCLPVFAHCFSGTGRIDESVSVPYAMLSEWLDGSTARPVFLLYSWMQYGVLRHSFLCLREWLFSWQAETYLRVPRQSMRIAIHEFREIGSDARYLREALEREVERNTDGRHILVAEPTRNVVFPLTESGLLRHLEYAPLLELPAAVESNVRMIDFRYSESAIRARAPAMNPPRSRYPSVNRLRFRQFIATIKAFEDGREPPPLPEFRVSELHCWRVFVSVYPRSVRFLDAVINHKAGFRDAMFASALISVLALADAEGVEGAARDAQRRVQDIADGLVGSPVDALTYAYRREIHRGLVESGCERLAKRHIGPLLNLVDTYPHWEKQFLTEYGWSPRDLKANLERKLHRPSLRDLHLRRLYELIEDLRLRRFRPRPAQSGPVAS